MRDAVDHVQNVCQVSQRRACRVLGASRTTMRYESVRAPDDDLINVLAQLRVDLPTWGYRKLTGVLRERGWHVHPKRVHRIWKEQGWQRRTPRKRTSKATGQSRNACHIRKAEYANHAWAVDFVVDRTWDGKPLKILTILDEYTREALAIEVRRSMGQEQVKTVLANLFKTRGTPEFVRSDHGGEFSGDLIQAALKELGSETALIAPGSPWQNGKNERFNGILSQEVLSREVWGNLLEAQVVIEKWRTVYNQIRPHGSLNMMTPHAYAEQARQDGTWRSDQNTN